VEGAAAPHPLRRHGLLVAGLAPVVPLVAARDGGGNAGSPGLAHVASPVRECEPVVHRQMSHYFG
jgi:hypothetical protein